MRDLLRPAAMLAASAVVFSGCGNESDRCANVRCEPCAPPFVSISVADSVTGGPVDAVSVSGGSAAWTCAEAERKTKCTPDRFLAGTPPIELTVAAPGYATASTQVVAEPAPASSPGECCGPCATYAAAPVALVRR